MHFKSLCNKAVPKLEIDSQLKVVSILGTIDDLYLCNLDRITKSKQIILNLYQEWFINFKFPNHEQVEFVDGIPEGWEYNELIELFVLQRGFDLSNSKRILGDVPIYASTGIVGYHNENKVLEKTVITGRSGSLGEVMITNGPSWPLNTTLWVKEFKKFTPEMAYFTLKNLELESFNAGAAVPTLNRNDVHKVKILTPTKEIINEFSKLASQIFDQIHMLKLKNEKLVELKETLLPRLMSGEIDVSKLSSIE
ncbi:restriction endonuclease subunit S [Acinetobacter lwoffii]|uniref:restriction endonuclease subunit S n=1 Tax=Acinetobacter lwoffii TaxID=28090 RepID=UPI003F8D5B3C